MFSFQQQHIDVLQSFTLPKVIKNVTLDTLLSDIEVSQIPKYKKGTPEYSKFKSTRNCVTLNAKFNGKPSYESLQSSTGLLFCEIDSIPEDEIDVLINQYYSLSFVLAIYKSLSGTGIHIICVLHDHVKQFINENPKRNFKAVYSYLNETCFHSRLDMNSAKITQLTVISSDEFIQRKEKVKPFNINTSLFTVEHECPPSEEVDFDAIDLDSHDIISIARTFFSFYPDLKSQFKYSDMDDPLHRLFFEYFEYYDFTLKFTTRISERFFTLQHGRNNPIYIESGVKYIKVSLPRNPVKQGNRARRMKAMITGLLFNSPFIRKERLLKYCFEELNTPTFFSEPLQYQEIENIVEYMHHSWVSGNIRIPKGRNKYVFFSRYAKVQERQKVAFSFYNKNRTESKIKIIINCYSQLISNNKKVSIGILSKETGISTTTIYRYAIAGDLPFGPTPVKGTNLGGHSLPLVGNKNIYMYQRETMSPSAENRIYSAIEELQDGKKITKKRIADQIGCCERTVKRNWKKFKTLIEEYNLNLKTKAV